MVDYQLFLLQWGKSPLLESCVYLDANSKVWLTSRPGYYSLIIIALTSLSVTILVWLSLRNGIQSKWPLVASLARRQTDAIYNKRVHRNESQEPIIEDCIFLVYFRCFLFSHEINIYIFPVRECMRRKGPPSKCRDIAHANATMQHHHLETD